ncbi:MAG: hypothetical protein NC212_05685 [Staphylococcus sp.]|nr:hypothetical protein [Staphylococcus sp.]
MLLLLSQGCNSDIFIEHGEAPSVTELEIPDGGEGTVTFPTDGLRKIQVYFDGRYDCETYYADGSRGPSFSRVGSVDIYNASSSSVLPERMVVSNIDAEYEVSGSPSGYITIRSVRNTLGEDVVGSIKLEYDYRVETVSYRIGSSYDGKVVYKAVEFRYTTPFEYRREPDRRDVMTISNYGGGAIHQSVSISDYFKMFVIMQANYAEPIDFDGLEIEYPTYDPATGKPGLMGFKTRMGFRADILTAPDYPLADGKSFSEVYRVEVPGMTMAKVWLSGEFFRINTNGTLILVNPRTGEEFGINVYVSVQQPVDYELKTEITSLSNGNNQ